MADRQSRSPSPANTWHILVDSSEPKRCLEDQSMERSLILPMNLFGNPQRGTVGCPQEWERLLTFCTDSYDMSRAVLDIPIASLTFLMK
jgi:hypothetical protein